ncbi:hypothetical protein HYW43_00280 [Candidatus Daviesbacteria bacterium]|nr:hypothetical protein [Candidatus Daviesbacteria bacterium]
MNGEQYPELRLQQTQEFNQVEEFHPLQLVTQGVEFLSHLNGFEEFWVHARDDFMLNYPQRRTMFIVVWGRTGVGKRLAASQIFYLADHDPKLQKGLAEQNLQLRKVYIPFAESANLAKLRGEVDPSHGHGQYTLPEYRSASIVNWEFTARELNNFEGPTLAVVEPSGPTAYVYPDATMEGPDRAFSTVYLLSKYYKEGTRVLVIKRGPGLVDRVLEARRAILEASWDEVAAVLDNFHLQLLKGEKQVDLKKLSRSALIGLKRELIESMAPPMGVMRSNQEMDELMLKHFRTQDENEFWPKLLSGELGWTSGNYGIVENELTDEDFTLHQHSLIQYDPMQQEMNMRKRLQKLV